MDGRKYDKTESEKIWDDYYNESSTGFIRTVNRLWFARVFQKSLLSIAGKNGMKILEVGCGEGFTSARISKLGNESYLMDISINALHETGKNFRKLGCAGAFVKGDIFSMGLKSESFDVVWNQGVLEHFDNAETAIKEMWRVVRKGGYLVIYVPGIFSPLNFYHAALKKLHLMRLWPFEDQIFYSKRLLERQVTRATGRKPETKRLWSTFGFSLVSYLKK